MVRDLAAALARFTARQSGESPYETAIPGVIVLRATEPHPPICRMAQPTICIVAQGAKWATFGGNRYTYRAGEALVVGVDAPAMGRVTEASPEEPCLCLLIGLDLDLMRGVAEELGSGGAPHQGVPRQAGPRQAGPRGVLVSNFEGPLADCALRMVRLLDTPEAIGTLAPIIMREICYWLLSGPDGGAIARMCCAAGPSQQLMRAMRHLREHFAETLRIADLAGIAHLSVSAFHRQFKALTGLSPLQYQKQMRLLRARQLMAAEAMTAAQAALSVGYESASQFSRDYARQFGLPPKQDARRIAASLPAMVAPDAAPPGRRAAVPAALPSA
ncbi:AraC family transcriptional regulator [Acidisoma sp. C75]